MKYRISWTDPGTDRTVTGAVLFTSLETADLAAAVLRALSPDKTFWSESAEDGVAPIAPVQ